MSFVYVYLSQINKKMQMKKQIKQIEKNQKNRLTFLSEYSIVYVLWKHIETGKQVIRLTLARASDLGSSYSEENSFIGFPIMSKWIVMLFTYFLFHRIHRKLRPVE